ncbi:fibronectin type III domain-containing protein [Microbulbifer elongatus]|uniref:Fibronectin type III domain-containing protein n=1 Tax=Microbulbifer elongatus TaxID=86173 RepID=A0ABT1NXM4_9GAMM|nr:fibronectin type III domain-containing protein [Microbulbifer elongatus]MCQ3828641.1 fibronectin type III domain-containing protein [Microbulbifer elongatus]
MKPLPWAKSALALCIMGTLTACGGGGSSSAGEGDIADLPEPPPVVVVPPEESGITNTPLPIVENFGEYTGFDQSDTIDFFSPNYKALATADSSEYEDARPAFYYPTCCFFDQDDPNMEITVDNEERLGIVSDAGDPSLLISNARFSIGQTKSDMAADGKDPKKDSTPGSDGGSGWGELDLSEPYRISFCVASASGSGSKTQIYVNNNTSSEADSIHGGGSLGSRIFDVETGSLIPGQRVVVNVPGDTYLEAGGVAVDIKDVVIGTENSFLQLRVSSGGTAIIDDLLIEKQSEDGQASLPECKPFQAAEAPKAPEAPGTVVGDSYVQVGWPDILGATGYELAYNTVDSTDGATIVPAADIVGTSHLLDELENGTTYYVFLRAENSAGISDWSPSASATPEAPQGEACVPTSQVDTVIPWSVYDGCRSPSEEASIVYNTSTPGTFDFGSSDTSMFVAIANENEENIGHAKLDTTTDAGARSRGEVYDIFTEGYPKHFTAIARIKADNAAQRGFELQTYFAEAGKRVNMMLRPDQGETGEVRLEKFINGDTDVKVGESLLDGEFHIYHIAFTMTDADTLNAKVFVDGSDTPIIDETSTGREDSSANNKLRVGEDSSSAHLAEVDWIIWTTDAMTAAKLPSELVDQLPTTVGELGDYGTSTSAWGGSALDLAGASGSAPVGEVVSSTEDAVTIKASGGSVSSDSVRKFFAYQEVTAPFTFTARLSSVALADGAAHTVDSNSYRFGIAVMESLDASLSGDIKEVGRFATIDYWVEHGETDVALTGSRAHKLDVGDTEQSKRSRSSADLALDDLLKIEIIDEDGTPRVIRSVSKDNGASFTQLNSSAFKDEGMPAAGFPTSWYVGVYGAPGDELVLEFTDIEITEQ